jgi:hypothetical protein
MTRFDPDDVEFIADPPSIEVEIMDNPVVAELLGPDGEPLAQLRERPYVPFGFH